METILHNWVCAVAAAGGLCAVCMYLCPAGRVKYVLQMASACVMVLALFSPFIKLRADDYASVLAAFREQSTAVMSASDDSAERLNRMVIEREYAEYIWDKAQTYGLTLTDVAVRAVWDNDGYWVPHEAEYTTADILPEAFLQEVTKELGIPEERQKVRETNE